MPGVAAIPLDLPSPSPSGVYGVLYRMWAEDRPNRFEFLSEGADQLVEMSAAEIQQALASQTLPLVGIDEAAFYYSMEQSLRNHTQWVAEFGWLTPKTKQIRWIRAQDFPRKTPEGAHFWLGVMIDITPLKKSNQALRAANQIFTTHLENSPAAFIEWDAQLRVTSWAGQAPAMFGWEAEEVLGKTPFEFQFVYDEDIPQVTQTVQGLLNGTEPRSVVFNRNYHKSGQVLYCEWHNSVVLDEQGRIQSIISLVLDVSEQQTASAARKFDEERLRSTMLTAGLLAWSATPDDWRLTYSHDPEVFFASTERDPSRDTPEVLWPVHPEHRQRVWHELSQAVQTGQPFNIEFRGWSPIQDTVENWYCYSGNLGRNESGAPQVYGVTQNITERRHATQRREALELALAQGKERESRGLLVTGIAHEFNNLHTIIHGHLTMTTQQNLSKELQEHILAALQAAQRAIELCRQLSFNIGNQRIQSKPLDLKCVVQATVNRLPTAQRYRVRVHPCDCELHLVGDEFKLQDLFQLLFSQAFAANPDGASLIEVNMTCPDREAIRQSGPWEPLSANGLLVRIKDSRPVREAEVLQRCLQMPFDPETIRVAKFIPASIRSILDLHHGQIWVSTENNTFAVELLFPTTGKQLTDGILLPLNQPQTSTNKLALVADDEPNIRELVAQLVEELGYEVQAVADGQAAIDAFTQEQSRVALVVTDVVMPHRTGWDVLKTVRTVRPDLPVLLMTGYNPIISHQQTADPRMAILMKPFRLEELLNQLDRLIASSETPTH